MYNYRKWYRVCEMDLVQLCSCMTVTVTRDVLQVHTTLEWCVLYCPFPLLYICDILLSWWLLSGIIICSI